MEQEIQNQGPLFGLSIDPIIKSHLSETARWGKFLSIMGFIGCALLVLFGIFFISSFSTLERRYGTYDGPSMTNTVGPAMMVVYILIAIVYFFPCLFLLRFSNKMKTALATDNQADLTISFQNLKVMFRYVGILTIIALSLWVLAFVFGGLGAMLSR
jgi:heme/copper-type cytochrome/quinol oxidase subunit 2